MKTKIFAIALVIILLVFSLPSCKNTGNGEGDASSSLPETTVLPEKIKISSGKTPIYTVIRSEFANSDFASEFVVFVKDLKEKTGAAFRSGDDFLSAGQDKSDELEIIFGTSNRPECKDVYDLINYDGYAVKKVGNKIIIAAYNAEQMNLAVDAFFSECLTLEESDGEKNVYFTKEVLVKGNEPTFFNSENQLSDYRIIYSSDAEDAAKILAGYVEKRSGILIECLLDTESEEAEKEILLGDTNRKESKEDADVIENGFIIRTSGKKVIIRSGLSANYRKAVMLLDTNYMLTSPCFNFLASISEEYVLYEPPGRINLTSDADFRVMSFNILSEEWTAEAVLAPRIEGVCDCILTYSPDVIGIQEVSVNWYKVLKEKIGDEYEFVNTDAAGTTNGNYTGLAYKKSRVELLDTDLYYYTVYNSLRLRLVNMGHFKLKESGKEIIVTDTHFNADHKGFVIENQNRILQATEFVAKIQEYKNKYNCPVVCTGDFNCEEETEPYAKVLESGLLAEAKYTALETHRLFHTYHTLGYGVNESTVFSIDHIFHTNDVVPLYYTVLFYESLRSASDHCPIYADFKFN